MKKVLSFALALALVGVCFGQVTITHNGNNVAAGATIEISTDESGSDVEFFSFDISTVMPGVPGDKTVVTVEGSWYKSTDGQIVSREKDPSEYVATYNLKSN